MKINLLTLMLLQTCMTFFILWNTIEDFLKNADSLVLLLPIDLSDLSGQKEKKNIVLYVTQKTAESHTVNDERI